MQETCAVCDEGITNPICAQCLEQQMQAFFGEKSGRPNLFIKRLAMMAMAQHAEASYCVVCSKAMGVCAHCFADGALHHVRAEYPELEEDFLLHFDYHLCS